ncbi:hypothetical protein PC116_g9652 [Phytophthora cactorum]|uniref:Uncharacterized protein n=1 Tax=Phytophthora cactorum TaxID=29920 RepID=A0A329T2Q6_9STRA|nr:hypothetical protein GQ600_7449 [Phytophthora cactorum]KAG3029608.1 hypothetical protein PC119_g6545 [Phytophthora cactorum]KAG4242459.1 hypothetical protein PC116_g9652 [Phytophthora cactorum]RAW42940.1 hypothetical protein PC110_g891 [Phytophthora cactorum]
MPKRVLWREVNVTEDEADSVFASLKSFQINKMTPIYCDDEPHKIRYILLKCISELRSTEASSLCPWCGKLLVCLSTRRSSLYQHGEHFNHASSPKGLMLNNALKKFCRELIDERL